MTDYAVYISLLCTAGDPVVMVWTVEEGEFRIFALRPLSWLDA